MKNEVAQLLEAASISNIKHVAIVDDVFDTPPIGESDFGEVLRFLKAGEAIRAELAISEDIWQNAISDINEGVLDSDSLAGIAETLYLKFVETVDAKYDPAGVFDRNRADSLKVLRPLLELLKSCESLTLKTYGSLPRAGEDQMPDLVLVDLILDSQYSPSADLTADQLQAAAERSIERVGPLRKNDPSIILMSSHGEKGKAEADKYRESLDGVYSSRFGFVDKGHIQKPAANELKVEAAARDTLLDIFQTYTFGRALSEALTRWIDSAGKAVGYMGKDIRNLQLKEIAYLVQFRLAAEGQGLEEYLEWFFGEALLDYIIRAVDEEHHKKALELALSDDVAASIDGGFEPTRSVAKMFHRVRVESKRNRPRKNFRLGDLYLRKADNRVLAVMTPDCDLVLRKDAKGNEKRNVEHLLFVPGQISDLEKVSASVGDFLMINHIPHNIQWLYKKVHSAPISGTLESAGQSGADYEYLGTLRPLYAQEIQANLVNHISRVGVAVPPVIGLPAVAALSVQTDNGVKDFSSGTQHAVTFPCSLIPSRSSDQSHRAVFDRDTIRKIRAAICAIKPNDVIASAATNLADILSDSGGASEIALKSGPKIGDELGYGIRVASKRTGDDLPWCALVISPVKVTAATPVKVASSVGNANVMPAALGASAVAAGIVDTDALNAAQGQVTDRPG